MIIVYTWRKITWGNMFMKVNLAGHVRPSIDDHCKVFDMASLVNHPRFFLRLSLLVLLMVLVMREMNNSWLDGRRNPLLLCMNTLSYLFSTPFAARSHSIYLDNPEKMVMLFWLVGSPLPNWLSQTPPPLPHVRPCQPASSADAPLWAQRISHWVSSRKDALGVPTSHLQTSVLEALP